MGLGSRARGCASFLRRGRVQGVTSSVALAETTHRGMLAEVVHRQGVTHQGLIACISSKRARPAWGCVPCWVTLIAGRGYIQDVKSPHRGRKKGASREAQGVHFCWRDCVGSIRQVSARQSASCLWVRDGGATTTGHTPGERPGGRPQTETSERRGERAGAMPAFHPSSCVEREHLVA